MLPRISDLARPVEQQIAMRAWRNICERIRSVLARAAGRALRGDEAASRRALYVTSFSVPCPLCLDAASPFPAMFDREMALHVWRTERTKIMPCGAGHLAVPLERILSPDAFLSYSWGRWDSDPAKRFPTQQFVRSVKTLIEDSGDDEVPSILCWFDLERMRGSTQVAMRDGVESTSVFVCFLDLPYLLSDACAIEFEAARAKGKHILPLVLPGFSLGDPLAGIDRGAYPEDKILRVEEFTAFLTSKDARDMNVSEPFILKATSPAQAELVAAHVSRVVLERSTRQSLLSGTGFLGTRKRLKKALKVALNVSKMQFGAGVGGARTHGAADDTGALHATLSTPPLARPHFSTPSPIKVGSKKNQAEILESLRKEREVRLNDIQRPPKTLGIIRIDVRGEAPKS